MRIRNITSMVGMCLCVMLAAPLLMGGNAWGQNTWVDEIGNSLTMYKGLYPSSDFKAYEDQLSQVKEAIGRNDRDAVTTGMSKWFKMLRNRAHGIDDLAASELMNFAVMVTPVEEYNISVPR